MCQYQISVNAKSEIRRVVGLHRIGSNIRFSSISFTEWPPLPRLHLYASLYSKSLGHTTRYTHTVSVSVRVSTSANVSSSLKIVASTPILCNNFIPSSPYAFCWDLKLVGAVQPPAETYFLNLKHLKYASERIFFPWSKLFQPYLCPFSSLWCAEPYFIILLIIKFVL